MFCNAYIMCTLRFVTVYIWWRCTLCDVYVLKTLRFGTITLCAATLCNITLCSNINVPTYLNTVLHWAHNYLLNQILIARPRTYCTVICVSCWFKKRLLSWFYATCSHVLCTRTAVTWIFCIKASETVSFINKNKTKKVCGMVPIGNNEHFPFRL